MSSKKNQLTSLRRLAKELSSLAQDLEMLKDDFASKVSQLPELCVGLKLRPARCVQETLPGLKKHFSKRAKGETIQVVAVEKCGAGWDDFVLWYKFLDKAGRPNGRQYSFWLRDLLMDRWVISS
jgi:hypothetical protein